MAITLLVLLSCLAYGVVAHPPASHYWKPAESGHVVYRPSGRGSVHVGQLAHNGLAGHPISTVRIGGVGHISSGYQHSAANQQAHQFPSHGSVKSYQTIGAPIAIGQRLVNSGYHHSIPVAVTSGHTRHTFPIKYSNAPY